jgi:hypothetical protein
VITGCVWPFLGGRMPGQPSDASWPGQQLRRHLAPGATPSPCWYGHDTRADAYIRIGRPRGTLLLGGVMPRPSDGLVISGARWPWPRRRTC